MLQAITFDFWWTLYQNGNAAGERWRLDRLAEILAAAGYPRETVSIAQAVQLVRKANERQQEELGLDWAPEEQVALLLEQLGLPGRLGPELPELLEAWTTPLLLHPPTPMPGAQAVLRYLAGRYRLGLICNTGATPGWVLRRLLEADGLLDYFQVLTFAAHVGDNPRTDVDGARQAGMRAIWFDSHAPSPPAPAADGIITALAELPDVLAGLA